MEVWPNQAADAEEGKISRGWRLTQAAWKLIREEPTMLALALGGIFFGTTFSLLFAYLIGISAARHANIQMTLLGFVALYLATLTSVFFNVGLACAASAAFDGERMSAGEALRMAWGKRRQIAQWSLISALVGTLIAELANRLPGGARLVARFVGAVWGLATIFVIPILAMEGVGATESLRRSISLFKRRWGEDISGQVSIGAWAVVATIPLVVVLMIGVALLHQHPEAGVVLLGLSLISLVAVFTSVAATQQVFAVALYRYAIDAPIGGFSTAYLEYPFVPDKARPKRKSWVLRIGGAILGLFLVLGVIGAIVGPRHRTTAAEGYFHIDYAVGETPSFSPGTPVIFAHRQIGTVLSTGLQGSYVEVVFKVDPRFREIVESKPAHVERLNGIEYLRLGGQAPPPSQSRGST